MGGGFSCGKPKARYYRATYTLYPPPLKIGHFFIPDHERCSETGPVLVNDLQTPPLSQKEPFFVQNVAQYSEPVRNQFSDFCSFEFNFLRYGRS